MDLENVICIITKNLVNVAMRSDAWFYNIFMYLYNKNILKYAQILVTSGRFMIFHIEGHSNIADTREMNMSRAISFQHAIKGNRRLNRGTRRACRKSP